MRIQIHEFGIPVSHSCKFPGMNIVDLKEGLFRYLLFSCMANLSEIKCMNKFADSLSLKMFWCEFRWYTDDFSNFVISFEIFQSNHSKISNSNYIVRMK